MTTRPRHAFGRVYVGPVGAAAGGLVLACAVAGWTARRAVTLEPVSSPPSTRGAAVVADAAAADTLSDARYDAAVARDPFHPERRRPGEPFRLPGDAPPDNALPVPTASPPVSAPPPPPPPIRLVGTVVIASGDAFAMCQLGTDPPKVVRRGEQLGAYTLVKIEQGRAVFRMPNGDAIDLRAPKTGS